MYKRILVPFDASPTSKKGLEEAIQLSRLSGGKVRLLYIAEIQKYATGFETFSTYLNDVIPFLKEEGHAILNQGKELAKQSGVEVETMMVESIGSRVCELVIDDATSWKADIIVLGTHGRRGVRRFFLGSDAEQILRLSPLPVLLVRNDEEEPPTL